MSKLCYDEHVGVSAETQLMTEAPANVYLLADHSHQIPMLTLCMLTKWRSCLDWAGNKVDLASPHSQQRHHISPDRLNLLLQSAE